MRPSRFLRRTPAPAAAASAGGAMDGLAAAAAALPLSPPTAALVSAAWPAAGAARMRPAGERSCGMCALCTCTLCKGQRSRCDWCLPPVATLLASL
jgi:hypothetical protein